MLGVFLGPGLQKPCMSETGCSISRSWEHRSPIVEALEMEGHWRPVYHTSARGLPSQEECEACGVCVSGACVHV